MTRSHNDFSEDIMYFRIQTHCGARGAFSSTIVCSLHLRNLTLVHALWPGCIRTSQGHVPGRRSSPCTGRSHRGGKPWTGCRWASACGSSGVQSDSQICGSVCSIIFAWNSRQTIHQVPNADDDRCVSFWVGFPTNR